MNLIKLTNSEGNDTYICLEHIVSFFPDSDGTYIDTTDGKAHYVMENIITIFVLIGADKK